MDITRNAFDPDKRYTSVRQQQGRVLTDDDTNEAARIGEEEERRSHLDIIGPHGSPDNGFAIQNGGLNGAGEMDFEIGAGTLYLGGRRLWNPKIQQYALQQDWLQQPATERAAPTAGRRDLVYVESWHQAVTAPEDRELYEVALAGPDTSFRLRTMQRVRVATDVSGDDCTEAWNTLTAAWDSAGLGAVDETCERVVDAELQVGFIPGGDPADLCNPPVAGGYLGAENQAIRVQLVDDSTLTWGFDNGCPLYRVDLAADQLTITFQTEPKDQAHWPLSGQIVELLPWSTVLPNQEKTAELSGHLARIASSYDPNTRTITLELADQVPANFGEEWLNRADQADLAPPFYYLRMWDRGDDKTSPAAIPFVPNTPLPLGTTGLEVTITGSDFVTADHWIIAARPATPNQVVPWSLEVSRGPHGVRRFFAPLALVEWKDGPNGLTFDLLDDCRPSFLPLTQLQTCCTHTVGDGVITHGKFTSIQKAVDALPANGGKVCILAGEYREFVSVEERVNVTLEGCGPRTILRAPEDAPSVIRVRDSQHITIRDLAIEAEAIIGVEVLGTAIPPVNFGAPPGANAPIPVSTTEEVVLERLSVAVRGRQAVQASFVKALTLQHSNILGEVLEEPLGTGPLGRWPSLVCGGEDLRIRDNEILAINTAKLTNTVLGGIQIVGGSERVEIRNNRIHGGNGDGITLGSWAWSPTSFLTLAVTDYLEFMKGWITIPQGVMVDLDNDGCPDLLWFPLPPPDDNNPDDPLVPISMGAVEDVLIANNRIEAMGRSGVGVARFFDLSGEDEFITVNRLRIEGNEIRGCILLDVPELPAEMRGFAAQGAVTLADGEDVLIRQNIIERNGTSHLEPICGVFALRSEGIVIEANRIVDNGARNGSPDPARAGLRGGIVLRATTPPSDGAATPSGSVNRQTAVPSARIHGNVVVVPEGRALLVLGLGPMTISDNELASHGPGTATFVPPASVPITGPSSLLPAFTAFQSATTEAVLDFLGGVAATVVNAGLANELGSPPLWFFDMGGFGVGPAVQSGFDTTASVVAGGNILFHDNQVSYAPAASTTPQLASAVLLSNDDVSIQDSHIDSGQAGGSLACSLFAMAFTVRAESNRLKEVPSETTVSAFTYGSLNVTAGNVSTNCLLIQGGQTANANNLVLIQPPSGEPCRDANQAAAFIDSVFS